LRVSTPSPGKPVLTLVNPAESGFIIVIFPPQNIAEQAFWLAADEPGKALNVQPAPDQPPYPLLPSGPTYTPSRCLALPARAASSSRSLPMPSRFPTACSPSWRSAPNSL